VSHLLPLKIAHLFQESSVRFHEPLAAQLHIYHTILGLQQAGHAVSLLALQGREVLCTDDLEVFRSERVKGNHFGQLGLSGNSLFKGIESGVRRVQTEFRLPYLALFDSYRMADAIGKNLHGFELIHERFNLLAVGGALASKRLGIPLVLEVNADLLAQRNFKGIPERGLRRQYAVRATRFCFAAAEKIICISEDLKNHLETNWNIKESKLDVLPCAADVKAFAPNGNTAAIRQRLALNGEPVVMWVGGFYPWHDLELLLESFTQVLQSIPNAKLLLVGDGQTRSAVAQKVAENGLRHAVILTGAVAHAEVPEMLAIADVAVVPAAPIQAGRGGTGTPLKLFEYMAAGKAIVATSLSQAAEVIEDGQTGLLIQPGDVDGFARAISGLLSDPMERGRLGQNARRQAVNYHSWELYTKQLETIYRDILK
jgi:glycosyltransferase involved in cell wall biosynthesis